MSAVYAFTAAVVAGIVGGLVAIVAVASLVAYSQKRGGKS